MVFACRAGDAIGPAVAWPLTGSLRQAAGRAFGEELGHVLFGPRFGVERGEHSDGYHDRFLSASARRRHAWLVHAGRGWAAAGRLAEADAGDGDLGEQVRGCGAAVGVAGQEDLELRRAERPAQRLSGFPEGHVDVGGAAGVNRNVTTDGR